MNNRLLFLAILAWVVATPSAKSQQVFLMPPEATPGNAPITELQPRVHYLKVTAKTMRLNKNRRGFFRKYYAAVHGEFSFQRADGTTVDLVTVTPQSNLGEIDVRNADRILHVNRPLLGPVPYFEGDVGAAIALIAVKSTDLSEPYLGLLGSVGEAAGVSFIDKALPFVSLIRDGVNTVTGASDAILEAAYDDIWTQPRAGYYVIILDTEPSFDSADLRIVESDVPDVVVLANKSGRELTGISYTIIHVEALTERSDWIQIPGLGAAYTQPFNLLAKRELEAAEKALQDFEGLVRGSWDLQFRHKQALITEVNKEFEEYRQSLGRGEAKTLKPLQDYELF